MPLLDRIRARCVVTGSGCWEWQGARTGDGYGAMWHGGWQQSTHRLAYREAVGTIPDGLVIDHLCMNRCCCNPEHLEAVTQGVNVRRQPRIANRTHCKAGHDLREERNAYVDPRGLLKCRRCMSAASDRNLASSPSPDERPGNRSECFRGHVLDESNTYVTPQGRRNCKKCRTEACRRYQARKVHSRAIA